MLKTNRSSSIYTILARTFTMVTIVLLWAFLTPVTAFFWTLFLVAVTFRLDSQMFGIGALILLILIPITQLKEEWHIISEELAIYVFYLLCIVVVLQLLEIRRKPATTEKNISVSQPKFSFSPKPESLRTSPFQKTENKVRVSEYMKKLPRMTSRRRDNLNSIESKTLDLSNRHRSSNTARKTRYHTDR